MQSSAIDLRPKTWADVIGQNSVVNGILNKLKTGVPPSFLFVGEPGSGKTTIAELLAREVNKGTDEEFLDIRRINAADKNGVDDARTLAEESKYHPTYGKYRVVILDEAHMLTPAAQNTLLIPTETANGSTLWIFCTTDPHKLLPALKSRCVTFEMKPFGEAEIWGIVSNAYFKHFASPLDGSTDCMCGTPDPTADKYDGYVGKFVKAVLQNNLTSPRDILYAWDKYVSGVPLDEAINPPPENNPVYTEIAKYAVKGDWVRTKSALQSLKSADVKGLKSVLCWFFKSELLNGSLDSESDAVAEALIRMGNLSAFEDGVTLAALTGILYHYARKRGR